MIWVASPVSSLRKQTSHRYRTSLSRLLALLMIILPPHHILVSSSFLFFFKNITYKLLCVLFLTHDNVCFFLVCFTENNYKASCENGNNNNNRTDHGSSPVENGDSSNAKTFTFRELASATKNFRQECLIGEGGFGRVFKGTLQGGEVTNFTLILVIYLYILSLFFVTIWYNSLGHP